MRGEITIWGGKHMETLETSTIFSSHCTFVIHVLCFWVKKITAAGWSSLSARSSSSTTVECVARCPRWQCVIFCGLPWFTMVYLFAQIIARVWWSGAHLVRIKMSDEAPEAEKLHHGWARRRIIDPCRATLPCERSSIKKELKRHTKIKSYCHYKPWLIINL